MNPLDSEINYDDLNYPVWAIVGGIRRFTIYKRKCSAIEEYGGDKIYSARQKLEDNLPGGDWRDAHLVEIKESNELHKLAGKYDFPVWPPIE